MYMSYEILEKIGVAFFNSVEYISILTLKNAEKVFFAFKFSQPPCQRGHSPANILNCIQDNCTF